MRAGGLRHSTITIEKSVEVKDEFGDTVKGWQKHIETKADVIFKTGNRIKENYEITPAYDVEFRIRKYHDVDEKMRVIYKSKKYRIKAIMPNIEKQMQTIITEWINE